jgi:trehalose synthase
VHAASSSSARPRYAVLGPPGGQDVPVRTVDVRPAPLERLAALLAKDRARRLGEAARRARPLLDGRVVWNVNATAQGGGVAEMLQALLAYGRGAGVDTRWLVLDGDPPFFAVTKRLHNLCHGEPGDGGALGEAERAHFEAVLRHNLDGMLPLVRPDDFVLLHDPQTAGLVDGLRETGAHVVWRSHIGRDTPNGLTDAGWGFLRPYLENADTFIFSRHQYAPQWVPHERLRVIAPSIDPFSAKNCDVQGNDVVAVLQRVGLLSGRPAATPRPFLSRDGSTAVVRPHTGLIVGGGAPPPPDARLVVQVSRWDRLKDMAGVLATFAGPLRDAPDDVHLMLVGPEVSGVTDDPEGEEVLEECTRLWRSLPRPLRDRVHLVCLPMDDVDENAYIVNSVQRHAYVVAQKSLVEGFGLTVTEAMWKGRPVVASAVGGIQDQIVDGRDGLLLGDPRDLPAFAGALRRLLDDKALAERLGAGARRRVRREFLGDRHLVQYVDLFAALLMDHPPLAGAGQAVEGHAGDSLPAGDSRPAGDTGRRRADCRP